MAQTAAGHAVHQLLLSVRALLDALRQWSEQRMDETQVSDAYVNFGNNFNTTITEFRALRIDMECVFNVATSSLVLHDLCRPARTSPLARHTHSPVAMGCCLHPPIPRLYSKLISL